MKTKIIALTASLASIAMLGSPVKAGDRGDKVAAAIGGFIGGVIVGSHMNHHHAPPVVHAPPPVVVAPPPPPAGYWREYTERVWVPATWVVTYDVHGHRIRRHVPGHYDTVVRRVWVEYSHGHPHYHGYAYAGRR